MRILSAVMMGWMMTMGLGYAQDSQSGGEPFAVVELFASEGCASCPPADDLLRSITADARSNLKRIYTLSFQVDYWNYLGWVDPFSSPQFSQRQQRYATILQGGMYTPQMIINGRDAFVGSDEARAEDSIERYLSLAPQNNLTLDLDQSGHDLKINYTVAQVDDGAVINFALVERGLQSHVTAGENSGSTLMHDNIVREFKTIELKSKQGSIVLTKPEASDLSRFSVITFTQVKSNMMITAASSVDLKNQD